MIGCPLAAAAVLSNRVQLDRWSAPHLAVRTLFDCCRWTSRVTQPVSRARLLLGCLLLTRVEVPSRLRFKGFGRFMMSACSLCLVRMLCSWMGPLMQVMFLVHGLSGLVLLRLLLLTFIGSAGGPIPCRGLVLGRGGALFRVVGLGGHKVRKALGNVSDVNDDAGVFLYRESSIAPMLDMRRRFKAVLGVLDAMIRYGISLACSVELTAQWDKILAVGPVYPVTHDDLGAVQGLDIGEFHRVVSDLHHRLCDLIHAVVVHRRDDYSGVAELDSGGSLGSPLQVASS